MMTSLLEWLLSMDPFIMHIQEEERAYLQAQQRDILLLNQRMDEIERRHRSKLVEAAHEDA